MRPREQPPPKTLGTEFLMSFPGDSISHILSSLTLLEERSVSCATPVGEDSGSWRLPTSGLPPLWDLALCPFAVVSHSHEYDSQLTLSPVTPLSEPKNLEVVLGNCDMMAT